MRHRCILLSWNAFRRRRLLDQGHAQTDRGLAMVVVDQGLAVAGENLQIGFQVADQRIVPVELQRAAIFARRPAGGQTQVVLVLLPLDPHIAMAQKIVDIRVVVVAGRIDAQPRPDKELPIAALEAEVGVDPVPAARSRLIASVRLVHEPQVHELPADAGQVDPRPPGRHDLGLEVVLAEWRRLIAVVGLPARLLGVSEPDVAVVPERIVEHLGLETELELGLDFVQLVGLGDGSSRRRRRGKIVLSRGVARRQRVYRPIRSHPQQATVGGLLRVRTYRSVYALPARYTTRKNNFPSSPAPGRTVTESDQLNEVEAKFQLSFKTKVLDDPLWNNGDVWFGYTQQSSWQAYNGDEPAPFRENNFEPEIMSTWRTGIDLPGIRWQFVNLGFVHQSNGRNQPRSRSWNRIYADFGFERGDWQFFVRPWLRVDPTSDDDNPDIDDFLGHGDVRVKWQKNKHDLGLTARWAPGENRGALQFDWHYPLVGDLKAYLQIFTGYGETLIDYNHRQTTIGLGVSLVQ